MDKLKFALFSIVVLVAVGVVGYWAITTLQSGSESSSSQKVKQLQAENDDLEKQIQDLTMELGVAQSKTEVSTSDTAVEPAPQIVTPTPTPKPAPTQPTQNKNQSLINELQSLINKKITIKLKATGTQVGTVQKFLNLYFKTSNKIDNDYGANMQKSVIAFQKDQGLKADGVVDSTDFTKMINWLKK